MRKANKYVKSRDGTETYVKLSDVHKEFGLWCKIHKEELKDMSEVSKKYFHYFVNLLPSVEFEETHED